MISWFLGTRAGRFVTGAALAVSVVMAAWIAGKREGRQKARSDGLEVYVKTRQEMDNADISSGDAAADDLWLRNRSKREPRL